MLTLRQQLLEYHQQKKALPAFNLDTFEIYQAVELAVRETGLPCIVQLSAGEDDFVQAERLFLLAKKARLEGLPIYLNMDHGRNLTRLEKLIRLGFDMVHFDGSTDDLRSNLSLTQFFTSRVHQFNPEALVEAEFNHIQSVDNFSLTANQTDPQVALDFVQKTHCDLLAVSIGNLHGVPQEGSEKLNLSLLSEISQLLPDTFLTLHGGSGIDSAQISQAIQTGIVKININTDLRLKFKQSLANSLAAVNSEKIYDYFHPLVLDLQTLVTQKLQSFANLA
jgi:ketose-bisphosphate aldolase